VVKREMAIVRARKDVRLPGKSGEMAKIRVPKDVRSLG
jgi:hypothetical protein